MSWQAKTKEVIGEICLASYNEANKGKKRHVPYIVPEIAKAMTDALNRDDEEEAKRLMLINRMGLFSLV